MDINAVNGEEVSKILSIILNIYRIVKTFDRVAFCFILETLNEVAHLPARFSLICECDFFFFWSVWFSA